MPLVMRRSCRTGRSVTWQCKLWYWNQQQVLEAAHEFRRRRVPPDAIVIDFFHWSHTGDYRFARESWPDSKAMCDELHEMRIKVMVSVWPQVSLKSENYVTMHASNLLVGAEQGMDLGTMFEEPNHLYDATNPEARRSFRERCKENYTDQCVDASWSDEAEPEYHTYDFPGYRGITRGQTSLLATSIRSYNKGFDGADGKRV